MKEQLLIRRPWGSGFTYRYKQSRRTLKLQQHRKWIEELAIPPAWTGVEINLDRSAKVHATGYDNKNRKQYIYNQSWRALQEEKKFSRVLQFAEKLPSMRRTTGQHLRRRKLNRNRVLAAMTRMLDNAYFRPGSRCYAKENETYGLTTLRSKHLKIGDCKLTFNYQGKSGKQQKKTIEDRRLVNLVKKLDELPGYEIFKYKDENGQIHKVNRDDLNDYIRDIMGDDYSAKDFRTWGATFVAAKLLNDLGVSKKKTHTKKNVLKVIDQVALLLGNTRSVARSSYIDPRIIDRYNEGRILKHFTKEITKEIQNKKFTNAEERALIYLLEQD